jgi:hypothetical protein
MNIFQVADGLHRTYTLLRKWTHRSTTSKPSASCALCDLSSSIHVSEGHLDTALHPCPLLRGPHQLSANTSISERLINEPALHETNRPRSIASIGMRPQPHFNKTCDCSIAVVRHQNRRRQSAAHAGGHDLSNFLAMLRHWSFRPKQLAHRCNLVTIRTLRLPDSRIRHGPHLAGGWTAITLLPFLPGLY